MFRTVFSVYFSFECFRFDIFLKELLLYQLVSLKIEIVIFIMARPWGPWSRAPWPRQQSWDRSSFGRTSNWHEQFSEGRGPSGGCRCLFCL